MLLVLASSLLATPQGDGFSLGDVLTGGTCRNPEEVVAADVDGDGDLDVLACSDSDDKVVWFPNVGFPKGFSVGIEVVQKSDGIRGIDAADLDGDGDTDLLIANGIAHSFEWWENVDGQGTFALGKVLVTGAYDAESIAAVDVDGDGDMDVLAASVNDDKVRWFRNGGQGTFSGAMVFSSLLQGPRSVVGADLDADGFPDAVIGFRWNDTIAWSRNLIGLGFTPPTVIDGAAQGVRQVWAGDIDGDGDQDVLGANKDDGEVAWYANGDGAGTAWSKVAVDLASYGPETVHAADLDGDGDLDVQTNTQNTFVWLPNVDGAGTFGGTATVADNELTPWFLTSADLDADGDQDVLSAAWGLDTVKWHVNENGLGAFGLEHELTSQVDSVGELATADFDGDGDTDVAAYGGDGHIGWWWNSDGAGLFGDQFLVAENTGGVWGLAVGDVDGDGDTDLLSSDQFDGEVQWYENAGAGIFGAELPVGSVPAAFDLDVGDVDGDGDLDVFCASSGLKAIRWFRNDGVGKFGPAVQLGEYAFGVHSVLVADMDVDGDQDAVKVGGSEGSGIHENLDGLGSFSAVHVVAPSFLSGGSSVGDIDGDGAPDLLLGTYFFDTIAWFRNTGSFGSAWPQVTLTTTVECRSLDSMDVDGDGDLDAVSVSVQDDEVLWFENEDGAGGFGPDRLVAGGIDNPSFVTGADVDGDGDPDVVAGANVDGDVIWYRNDSCGVVVPSAETVRLGAPPNPSALLPGVTTGPVLGATWDPVVDHAAFLPGAVLDVLAVGAGSLNLALPPYGTVLVDVFAQPPFTFGTSDGAPGSAFAVPIPTKCTLAGVALSAQALSTDGVAVALTNALDLTLGTD